MKRIIIALLAIAALASLTACRDTPSNQSPAPAYESTEAPPAEQPAHEPEPQLVEEYCEADAEDNRVIFTFEEFAALDREYQEFFDRYLAPVHAGRILNTTWSDANEIDPDAFSVFFTAGLRRMGRNMDDFDFDMRGFHVPADIFEPFIQSYFDVTTDHLRTAERKYDPDKNVYIIDGIGSAISILVTSAEQQGDVLILWYDVYSSIGGRRMALSASGRLFVQTDGESHRYIANEVEWFDGWFDGR